MTIAARSTRRFKLHLRAPMSGPAPIRRLVLAPSLRREFAWANPRTLRSAVGRLIAFMLLIAVVSAALTHTVNADDAESRATSSADALRLRGRYEEALEQYAAAAEHDPLAAALGEAACRSALGEDDAAEETLRLAVEKAEAEPANRGADPAASARRRMLLARAAAERAQLAWKRGDVDAANKLVSESLDADPSSALARWLRAEELRTTGRIDEATAAYRWFAEAYGRRAQENPVADEFVADDVRWWMLGLAQHARLSRDRSWFRRLVNEVTRDALDRNERAWPARLEAARLFLEKFNEADASRELNAALAINPRAAEAHALRARLALQNFDLEKARQAIDEALSINPALIEARLLAADVLLAELNPSAALERLEDAREFNPRHEETLGRIAAAYLAVDGSPLEELGKRDELDKRKELGEPEEPRERDDRENRRAESDSRLSKLVDEVVARNSACGPFFQTAGESCELMRRFPQAAWFYGEALRRMPELVGVRGQLGMTLMRLGDEPRAAELLAESFDIDPFNVRVKNTLEVLDVLQGYAVLETDHFVLRFDRGQDETLAAEMAEFLESDVYPSVVERFGYAPRDKTLIEIFNRAKNTSGHGWFSARMVGLPSIGTVGACAGKMVAVASPGGMPQRYNWARVMRHEFVHVVNLQQTDFNVPHWFTEGLAVWHEELPRPTSWSELLAARIRADRLFTLDTINQGFIRPSSGDDWTLAYCQAELYVEFMREAFGADAPARLLAAYAEQFDTPQAIQRAFDVGPSEFERRYREHVDRLVASFSFAESRAARSQEELGEALSKNADDVDALAELAHMYLQQGDRARAREAALRARRAEEAMLGELPEPERAGAIRHPLAAYVLARVYLSIGDVETALPMLGAAFDPKSPDARVLGLLAALRVRAKEWDEARRLYEIGAERFADDDRWLKGLSRVLLETKDDAALRPTLAKLADLDYDNAILPKKLAQLAADANDWEDADRWANRTLHVDVEDADARALRARSLAARGRHADAARQFHRALTLQPEQTDWRLERAEALAKSDQADEARRELMQVLDARPDDPRAKQLLESLDP